MSLLQIIAGAAAADAGTLTPLPKFPIILNADPIFPNLKPSTLSSNLITGWTIPETDSQIATLSSNLSKTLTHNLKIPKSLTQNSFISVLNAFFINSAEKMHLSIGLNPSHPDFTLAAMEKVGFLIGGDLAGPISDCCILLNLWELLESLIQQGLIGNLNSTSLIAKLIENNKPELLCLCVERIPDIRAADLLSVLKCFLSPSKDCYASMKATVRKQWESQAVIAIEKASEKGAGKKVSRLAKEAAILLVMAHDGFSSAELCLHHLFGSSGFDDLMVASAFTRLDGSEVLRLVRYFVKWVEKYQRFPEAGPCPRAASELGLKACDSVPSFEAVVRVLGLVLDEHYSYLVLNSKFHDEMRALERAVDSLASEARSCCPLEDIIKHVQSEGRQQRGE